MKILIQILSHAEFNNGTFFFSFFQKKKSYF